MLRPLAVVLSLQMMFAGVARAIDFHDAYACGDTIAVHAVEDGGGHEAPGSIHPGNCCFGSLLMGSPLAAPPQLYRTSVHIPPALRDSLAASWHSEAPERPPRN